MAGGSDVKAGGAYVELFTKGFKTTQQQLTAIGSGIAKIGAGVAAMGAAIVGPMTAAVAHFMDVGGAIDDMNARTGIARTEFAQLAYAADQTGTDLQKVEAGLRFKSAKGDKRTLDEIAVSLSAIGDQEDRVKATMEIFGTKAGSALLPMLQNLQKLKAEARGLGIGTNEQDIKNADELGDSFAKIKSQLSAIAFGVGAALAPPLIQAAAVVSGILTSVTTWINENRQLIVTIAGIGAALLVAGTLVATLGGGLALVGLAVGGIGEALPVLAAIAVPLGIAVAVCLVLAAQVTAVVMVMRRLDVSVADVIAGVTTLADLFVLLAKATVGWLRHLNPLVVVLERGSPILKGLAIAAGAATAAITVQAQSLANAASGWHDYADSIEEATDALHVADQMARGIAAAEEKRQRLRDEFLTADERGQRKEQEIRAAQTQVNNNRVLGFISEEQAQAEQRGLAIALQRHRLAEAERRRREAGGGRVAAPAGPAEPVAAAEKARIEMPSMTATTAAGALALTRGGSGQDPWRPTVEQLRELRRESVRQHEELVRELRDTRPKVSR